MLSFGPHLVMLFWKVVGNFNLGPLPHPSLLLDCRDQRQTLTTIPSACHARPLPILNFEPKQPLSSVIRKLNNLLCQAIAISTFYLRLELASQNPSQRITQNNEDSMHRSVHCSSSVIERQEVICMCKRKAMARSGFLEPTKWQSGVRTRNRILCPCEIRK